MSKKKTIVEGAFGLRLREDVARSLDELLKTLPRECRTLKRKTGLVTSSEFLPGEKADVAWVTTDDIDREGEVVLPDGLDLTSYQTNPVVLWNHDGAAPIGKAQWIKRAGNGIKAKTVYASRPDTHVGEWLPDTIFSLVQQGVLKGRSIGFLPLEMVSPSQEHIKANPTWEKANAIITKSMLFEYSVVSIPCNGAALLEAVSKGMKTDTLRSLGLSVPATRSKPALDYAALLARVKIDPKKIAKRVYNTLRDRGKV